MDQNPSVELTCIPAIEEHHFKVFCYIILVYHGRNFKFVGNFLSRVRFHNIHVSYVVVLVLFVYLQKDLEQFKLLQMYSFKAKWVIA